MSFPVAAGQRAVPAAVNHAYSQSDSNVTTVTATSATDLSSVYQIPASDAYAGLMYELTAWGSGTWGSTTHNLQFWTALAGSALGAGSKIAAGALPASQIFRWRYTARLLCVTTGSSGTWLQEGDGIIACYNTALSPGTAATNTFGFGDSLTSAITQDTTVANDFSVQADWGGTTCSITCYGTRYTRCG